MSLTFDGPNKRVILTSGTTVLDVRALWGRWVDWYLTGDNSKYLPAFDSLGGDSIDLSAGTYVPIYAFLLNGWRIRPQEATHTLNVTNGILLVSGGGDPFVNTLGSFVVRINYQQPVQAISYVPRGGGGSSLTAADVWTYGLEGTYTAEQIMRLMSAVLLGRVSGNETFAPAFRDAANVKVRVSATTDADGNRSSVTLDPL